MKPTTIEEALADDPVLWQAAMEEHLIALQAAGATPVSYQALPPGTKPFSTEWRVECHYEASEGELVRRTVELWVKGRGENRHVEGELPDTGGRGVGAPLPRWRSFRVLLGLASRRNWVIEQFVVDNRVHYLPLRQPEYIRLPFQRPPNTPQIFRLSRYISGMPEVDSLWFDEVQRELQWLDFVPSRGDPGVFLRRSDKCVIWHHFGDFMILAPSHDKASEILSHLGEYWTIRDTKGMALHGLKIAKRGQVRYLSQPHYIDRLAERFPEHKQFPLVDTPISTNRLFPADHSHTLSSAELVRYRELRDKLIWISRLSRPDTTWSSWGLPVAEDGVTKFDWYQALHIVRHLKDTRSMELSLGGSPAPAASVSRSPVVGYSRGELSPLNYLKDTNTYIIGRAIFHRGDLVCWGGTLDRQCASNMDAEMVARTQAAQMMISVDKLVDEVAIPSDHRQRFTPTLFCSMSDLEAAKHICFGQKPSILEAYHRFERTFAVHLYTDKPLLRPLDIMTKAPKVGFQHQWNCVALGLPLVLLCQKGLRDSMAAMILDKVEKKKRSSAVKQSSNVLE